MAGSGADTLNSTLTHLSTHSPLTHSLHSNSTTLNFSLLLVLSGNIIMTSNNGRSIQLSFLHNCVVRPRSLRPLLEAAVSSTLLVATSSAFLANLPHASADCTSTSGGGTFLHTKLGGSIKSSSILSCSSNFTHFAWIDDDGGNSFDIMTMDEARREMFNYLSDNIMPYDMSLARTLGYIPDNGSVRQIDFSGEDINLPISRIMNEDQHTITSNTIGAVDGLSDGIVNQTIFYSLQAKAIYPWTDIIPKPIYMEYVVPYAIVNEPRTDHRHFLFHGLRDILKDYERRPNDYDIENTITHHVEAELVDHISPLPREQMKAAVKLINSRLWSIFGRSSTTSDNTINPITFQAGLTPRIYDPLSVIAYGHSSCTGLAILLIAALRSVGIPSRMAGTPAWNDNPDNGNHSWLEVYLPGSNDDGSGVGEWIFLEPTPGIAEGDEDSGNADDLDRDACDRWFCNAEHFDGRTRVFATRYTKQREDNTRTHFPMAWSDVKGDIGVPGEDRSEYYTSVCGQCSH